MRRLNTSQKCIYKTWVKGHATEEHINKGITNATNKQGNDAADAAADRGTELYGADLIKCATNLQMRHQRYLKFMKDVSHHIVEGYLIHRELVDRAELKQARIDKDSDKKVEYIQLPYPDKATCRPLAHEVSINSFAAFKRTNNNANSIEQFLSNIAICPRGNEVRCITWIELYILYRSRGHNKPIQDSARKSDVRPTPDKLMKAFKKQIRGVVSRTLGQEEAKLFQPGACVLNGLIGVAILGKQTSLACNIAVTNQEAANIAQGLIKLNRTIANKHIHTFLNKENKLEPHELKFNGRAGWDSTIPILPAAHIEHINRWESIVPQQSEGTQPDVTFYECPRCSKVEPSSCRSFQLDDLDLKHKCKLCNKLSCIKLWKCQCKDKWYTCSLHTRNNNDYSTSACFPCNMTTAKGRPLAHDIGKVRKKARTSFQLTFNQNLDADFRRADNKRKRDNCETFALGNTVHESIHPSLLGPILKKRFIGSSLIGCRGVSRTRSS